MITIINEKQFDPDEFINIDLSENIILSTNKNDKDYIRENLDGTLSIKLDNDFNLIGEKVYSSDGNLIKVNYRPRIKIACPRGLVVNFFEPINIDFIFKLNIKYDIFQYYYNEADILRMSTPNVIIYENLNIDLIVDLNRLKLDRNLYRLNKNESIISFKFDYIFYHNEKKPIKSMYWFQHNEIFNNFKKNI